MRVEPHIWRRPCCPTLLCPALTLLTLLCLSSSLSFFPTVSASLVVRAYSLGSLSLSLPSQIISSRSQPAGHY